MIDPRLVDQLSALKRGNIQREEQYGNAVQQGLQRRQGGSARFAPPQNIEKPPEWMEWAKTAVQVAGLFLGASAGIGAFAGGAAKAGTGAGKIWTTMTGMV